MEIITTNATRMRVEYLPVSSLKTDPTNPRKHSPQQIKSLAKVIGELGFNSPILIDRHDVIIAGEARLKAAKLQGMEKVPVIRLEHLSSEQVRIYRIADNRLAELAEWDEDALRLEFKLLSELNPDVDLSMTGFDIPKIDMMLNPVIDEPDDVFDDLAAVQAEGAIVTQPGDLWIMGSHRILCGDALLPESYDALMQDARADLIFTDPPYNVPINGHVLTGSKKRHDEFAMASGEMTDKEFVGFLGQVIMNLQENARDGSIHYVCMDWRHMMHLLAAGRHYELKNICVWNKSNGGMGSLYRSKHEMIAVFKHGTEPHVNNIELGKHGRYRTNVWDYAGQSSIASKAENEIGMHPTPKPVSMIADALLDCSNMGDIILDPFGGSGSTLMAAEKVQRKARLIEIAPGYVDVTVRRWQEATKQQAVLLATGQTFEEVSASRCEVKHD